MRKILHLIAALALLAAPAFAAVKQIHELAAVTVPATGDEVPACQSDCRADTTVAPKRMSVSQFLSLLGAGSGISFSNPTFSLDYTATLAGNPAMNAGECRFATTGIICEGSTANGFETLFTVTNPSADRTVT